MCSPIRYASGSALAAASALGALAYSALFLALSLLTRRPVLLGLVYVLIWEGLLGRFVDGTRVLSVQQWVVAYADRMAPTDLLGATVSVPVALVLTAVVAVGPTALAIDRLRSFSVAGETSDRGSGRYPRRPGRGSSSPRLRGRTAGRAAWAGTPHHEWYDGEA